MSLGSLSPRLIGFGLLLGCGSLPQPQPPPSTAPANSEYVTITPDVSTYPPRATPPDPAPVDEREDVMASILAIPPGR
jgi:hypothetical protein